MILTLTVAAAAAVASLAAPASSDGPPVVVATTSIWADVVDELECADEFAVQSLIPPGGDAHAYEPSMLDREVLDGAALVVANGGGLEELLDDTLRAVADGGTPIVEVVDHVTITATTEPSDTHGDGEDEHAEDEHDHEGVDPHVWFDPTLVAEALPVVAEALVDAGADEATMDDCLAEYVTELEQLDREVTEILDVVPPERRLLVTNHDALGHFAERYDFEILGSVVPGTSTLAEASPGELDALADEIEATGVPAIFTEALETADEATALADRLGVEVVTLYTDSLGEPGSGAETYADLMRYDATAIADALGG